MTKTVSRGPDLLHGPVFSNMTRFFLPIMLGSLLQQLYSMVDAVVLGRLVGKTALAAVGGSDLVIINLVVGFFVGLSSGACVVVSQHYGAGEGDMVRKSVHTAILFSVVIGAVMTALGIGMARPVLVLLDPPADTLADSIVYLQWYFAGMIPSMVYNMGAAILRAVGDSKRPLYFLVASCLTNIALDLLFVVCFHMEVAGAALATIMSQLLSAVLVMITLIRTKESYRFIPKELRVEPVLLKRIIKIGLPAGLQSMMYSISNILIQANINGYGTNTIASWAVYGKIDGIFWMTMDAMGISVTTFAGQNFGAGKIKRLKKGTYVGLLMSTIITAVLGVFMFTAGPVLISLFTNDVDVMAESMSIIRFLVPFWFCYICVNVYPCTLRGVGDALIPMLIICVGTCILRVLWVFGAGAVHPGLYTTLTSYPLSWTITSLAFLVYYYRFSAMRKLNKLMEE